MNKASQKTKEDSSTPKIPASLVAHVHGVSSGTVAVSKCRRDKYSEKYIETEKEIVKAVDEMRDEMAKKKTLV